MENEAAERVASAASQKPIWRSKPKKKKKIDKKGWYSFHSWLKVVIFDILQRNNRFMYVRRFLKFVQKQKPMNQSLKYNL